MASELQGWERVGHGAGGGAGWGPALEVTFRESTREQEGVAVEGERFHSIQV